MTPTLTRVKIRDEFAVRGDGGIHNIDEDVVVTLRGRIVAVEQEVADVTTFGSEMKEYIPTGARIVTLLPLSAKLEVVK